MINIKEYRNKTKFDLNICLFNILHKQLYFRIKVFDKHLNKKLLLKNIRRDISQIKTLLFEKKGNKNV